jgi:tRNA(Ile)-lysidine synthase
MSDAVFHKVRRTIEEHQMLAAAETVVIGVSGGLDSMVLLHLLVRLRAADGLSLHAAHLDHGLRGADSAATAEFVRLQCEALSVPVTVSSLPAHALRDRRGGSLQNAAREARYRFLWRVADARDADRVALGHHLDDQGETVLMNLLRGSGTRGLGGMPPVRGRLIRPLIECTRDEVQRYALSRGVAYREDPSNRLPSCRRNRIRLELLPELAKRYNPRVAHALASAAAILREEDALLAALADEHLEKVLVSRGTGHLVLSALRLAGLPAALRRRILRRSAELVRGDSPGLSARQTLAFDRLLTGEKSGGDAAAPGGLRAWKAGDHLIVSVAAVAPGDRHGVAPIPLTVPGDTDLASFSLALRAEITERGSVERLVTDPWTAVLDAQAVGHDLSVRGWSPGDRFVPFGMRGHKKLQDVFVDAKIPRHRRQAVPLVVRGDDIVWVVGLRIGDRFKVTDSTTTVVRLRAVRVRD